MVKNMSSQKGSVHVIIIVVLVVALIGTVGFVFWQNFIYKDTPTNIEASQTTETKNQKSEEEDTQSYMVIEQWSVKVPLSQETDRLTYSIDKNGVASFRSSTLNAIATDCKSNSVDVARGTANQVVVNSIGPPEGSTFKNVYDSTAVDPAQLTIRSIKNMISDYYYVVPGYAGASCAIDQQSQATETQAMIAIVKAINAMVAN